MKKFWNLMLAALVIFGAVACTENQEENIPEAKKEPVLSFVANIANDETRVDVQNTDGVWTTVWEENETLIVYGPNDAEYTFTNADSDDKNVFTCYDEDVLNCVGKYVQIDNGYLDSKAGTKGSWIWAEIYPFDPTAEITLVAQTSFFKFTSAHKVTLSASDKIFEVEGEGSVNSVDFAAGEDIMVAFLPPTGDEVTLSYSIDGVKCKEITKKFEAKKIYNLGELNDKVVLLKPNVWYTGENQEWFAAHFWNSSSSKDVTLSKVSDDLYGCVVPEGMTHVIFCRMNPSSETFTWNSGKSGKTRPMWNRTYEFGVEDAPYNCHFIYKWGNGFADDNAEICPSVWGEKTIVSTDINAWGVIGSMTNGWKQEMKYPMVKGADGKLIARRLVLKKNAEFKVSDGSNWQPDNNYKITADGVYNVTCSTNGSNFNVAKLQ